MKSPLSPERNVNFTEKCAQKQAGSCSAMHVHLSSCDKCDNGHRPVAGFRKPPLERISFSKGRSVLISFGKATLKFSFAKPPYHRSSVKLNEGANFP